MTIIPSTPPITLPAPAPKIEGRPMCSAPDRLRAALYENAMSVPSTQGDYGHVGMIMPAADCQLLPGPPDAWVDPVHPGADPGPGNAAANAQIQGHHRDYNERLDDANDILHALRGPSSNSPLAPLSDSQAKALKDVADILQNTAGVNTEAMLHSIHQYVPPTVPTVCVRVY